MKLKTVFALAITVLIVNLCVKGIKACSLSSDYLPPSNYDLVKMTDVVVLAETVAYDSEPAKTQLFPLESGFKFKIMAVLKGEFQGQDLRLGGVNEYRGGSPENDFKKARPGAFSGACNAYDYQVGKKFVLFLSKGDRGWFVSGPPFTRINEEVAGINSPWVRAVKQYIQIARLQNEAAEKIALNNILSQTSTPINQSSYLQTLKADVANHFETPSLSKRFDELLVIFHKSPDKRESAMWAIAKKADREARPFINELVETGRWKKYPYQVGSYIAVTKDRELMLKLSANLTSLKTQKYDELRWAIVGAMIRVADESDKALMLQTIQSATEDEAVGLSDWFIKYPSREAVQIVKKLVNSQYTEKWELTLKLAGLGDRDLIEWAREFRKDSGENRWIAYYAIANSPLAEADELAKAIIKENDLKNLSSLIQGYGKSYNPNRWDRLREIIDLPNKDKEISLWLERTITDMFRYSKDQKALELLKRMKPDVSAQ